MEPTSIRPGRYTVTGGQCRGVLLGVRPSGAPGRGAAPDSKTS
jgi:hypothetical protein